jgi:hypothetical protein
MAEKDRKPDKPKGERQHQWSEEGELAPLETPSATKSSGNQQQLDASIAVITAPICAHRAFMTPPRAPESA